MPSSTAICSAAGDPYDAMTVVGEAGTYEGLVTRGVVGRGEVGGEGNWMAEGEGGGGVTSSREYCDTKWCSSSE